MENIVIAALDPVGLRSIRRIAGQLELSILEFASAHQIAALEEGPLAAIFELELPDALEVIARCKEKWPHTLVAGFLTLPDADRWRAAEDAGCDVVATRGALRKVLPERLERWRQEPGGRRVRLFPVDDLAGRLGVVKRLEESPVGPLAVYHIGGKVSAVVDVCPHAGARLSEGSLDMDRACITCPEHGSQFDVRTGERTRGPADDPIAAYAVVIEDGTVYIRVD